MTAPDLGPCQCEKTYRKFGFAGEHEHSDFEPYPCVESDCPCRAHQAPGTDAEPGQNQSQAPGEPQNQAPLLTIPAEINFAELRVTQTAQWLDQILAGIHETHPTPADHPPAVCALADLLEQAMPDHIDPFEALALNIRRLRATNISNTTGPRRALDTIRRKVRR